MSFYDFFFPEQAQASHLRQIARNQRRSKIKSRRTSYSIDQARERIEQLEDDLGTLALLVGAVVKKLDEKGTVTRDDLKDAITALDEADGKADGKLDPNVLRGMTE